MTTLTDELKKYFKETPKDQVLKDWGDNTDAGVKVKDFINSNDILRRVLKSHVVYLNGKTIKDMYNEPEISFAISSLYSASVANEYTDGFGRQVLVLITSK